MNEMLLQKLRSKRPLVPELRTSPYSIGTVLRRLVAYVYMGMLSVPRHSIVKARDLSSHY